MDPHRTRIVWIETPANPTWAVTDIAAAAQIAHRGHARLVVDSTVATPVHTRPLTMGADLVVHSATKFLNGHGDVLAGALVAAAERPVRAAHPGLAAQQRRSAGRVRGLAPPARACAPSTRGSGRARPPPWPSPGTSTRDPRLHSVLYPGLPDHPGHEIAARQMQDGFSGMLSFRVRDGEEAAIATAARVRVLHRATSLGGTESLIEHRSSVEGPSTPIPADILRLSIGLEHPDDLIADLDRALDHGVSGQPAPTPATDERATLRRTIIARGGDLTEVDGRAVPVGSPGAVEPVRDQLHLAPSGAANR